MLSCVFKAVDFWPLYRSLQFEAYMFQQTTAHRARLVGSPAHAHSLSKHIPCLLNREKNENIKWKTITLQGPIGCQGGWEGRRGTSQALFTRQPSIAPKQVGTKLSLLPNTKQADFGIMGKCNMMIFNQLLVDLLVNEAVQCMWWIPYFIKGIKFWSWNYFSAVSQSYGGAQGNYYGQKFSEFPEYM